MMVAKKGIDMALTFSEKLFYTTVKLSCSKAGKPIGTGTGFFYKVNLPNNKFSPVIITNKHVVAGCDRIEVSCHQATVGVADQPSGKFLNLTMDIAGPFIEHPSPDVDLCVIPVSALLDKSILAGTPMLFIHLDSSTIPKESEWNSFSALEEVTMLGCPNGIYDEVNKIPVARRGITATPLNKSYAGKPHFLVDMACFPGSSGSPVFIYNPQGYIDQATNTYHMDKSRFVFVGVLFAGPTITNTGQIILNVAPKVQVASMMHLGNVVKSSEISVLEDAVRKVYEAWGK